MEEEKRGNPVFSEAEARRVLESRDGRKLVRLLTKEHARELSLAIEALKQGDTARAKALLAPVMEQGEAAELIKKINGK